MGAKSADVVVSDRTRWRHVLVTSQDGLTGVGEATLPASVEGFDEALSSALAVIEGRPLDAAFLDPLSSFAREGLAAATVYSAIDQAATDIRAQHAGVPVAEFLASDPAPSVPLYANINRASIDRRPETFATNALKAEQLGYGAIKLAPFDNLTPAACGSEAGDQLIAAGVARVASVAEAVLGAEVMVDCHWRFSPAAAARTIPQLAELGVVWFECPLPETTETIDQLKALRELAQRYDMRLAGMEHFAGWEQFAPFVEAGAYDVVMPDIKHAGGYGAILKIAEKATAHGVSVSLHNPSGPVCHLASVHMAAAIGAQERLEQQVFESPRFFQITDPAPNTENGQAIPGRGPGLGTRLTT